MVEAQPPDLIRPLWQWYSRTHFPKCLNTEGEFSLTYLCYYVTYLYSGSFKDQLSNHWGFYFSYCDLSLDVVESQDQENSASDDEMENIYQKQKQ